MPITELKTNLHQMIEQEGDEQVLSHIKTMLEQNRNLPVDELGGQSIHEMNKEMDAAEAEIDSGIFSTQEEVTFKFEQLFKR